MASGAEQITQALSNFMTIWDIANTDRKHDVDPKPRHSRSGRERRYCGKPVSENYHRILESMAQVKTRVKTSFRYGRLTDTLGVVERPHFSGYRYNCRFRNNNGLEATLLNSA